MVETVESGLCSLCAIAPNRTSCTLPGCKNSIAKPKSSREMVAIGGQDEARKQMEGLSHFFDRKNKK